MNKRRSILGVLLILIGISAILKNLGVMPGNSFVLFGGIFLLYLWYIKRQQIFLVLGSLAVFSGALSLIQDLGIFRFRMSGELMLLALGILFLFFYYTKGYINFSGRICIPHGKFQFSKAVAKLLPLAGVCILLDIFHCLL